MNMLDEHVYTGHWFCPENPNLKVAGRFHFARQSGCELELFGNMGPEHDVAHDPVVILGMGIDPEGHAKQITLLRCQRRQMRRTPAGVLQSRYSADEALVGYHFCCPEETVFHTALFQYTQLYSWLSLTGFDICWIDMADVVIRHKTPEPVVVLDSDELRLRFRVTSQIHSGSRGEISMKEEPCLEITFSAPQPLEMFHEIASKINNLLTLAAGEASAIASVEAEVNDHGSVTWLRRSWHHVGPEVDAPLMNFIAQDLDRDLPAVIASWLDKYEVLKPICDLLFGIAYQPDMLITQKFIDLTQALEYYHAHFHRTFLPTKSPGQTTTLKHRIQALLADPYCTLKVSLPEEFAKQVSITRNYLVHHDPKQAKGAAQGKALMVFLVSLQLVAEAFLLKEIGLPQEQVSAFTSERGNWRRLRQWLDPNLAQIMKESNQPPGEDNASDHSH